MQTSTSGTQGWHIAQWGFWGWIETILKLIGIGAGMLAFSGSLSDVPLVISGNPKLLAVLLVAALTLGMVVAFIWRIVQREIVSLVFSALNVLGHAGLLIALLRTPAEMTLPLIFSVFFVLGELAKYRFLTTTGYTEAGQSKAGMLRFSYVMMGTYAVLTIRLLI